MQRADGIRPPRHLQPQHRHAERLPVVVGIDPSHTHQLVVGNPERVPHRAEVFLDQAAVEPVVAGGHGRVRREHGLAGYPADRVVEGVAVAFHPSADRLQRGEDRVSLVEMVDAGHDSHRPDRPHTADAEHEFLPDPQPRVAAVETARQLAVFGVVDLHVGVEQVEIDAAHRHLPDLGEDRARPRVDLHGDRFAVGTERRLDRQRLGPRLEVFLVLVAIDVELLLEVALIVEQTHRDERDAQAAGAFDVVAGEHAETARIDRHRFMDAELG